jgi:hypothetical protein
MDEDEPMIIDAPNSPTLDTHDGIIHSAKEFSGAMTLDMTDEEIATAVRITTEVREKYRAKWISKFRDPSTFSMDDALRELDNMEDEIKTRLANAVGLLATVDTVPILEGRPPVIEFVGMMPGTNVAKYGQDHEKKEWEVKRATARGEDFLGQKDG